MTSHLKAKFFALLILNIQICHALTINFDDSSPPTQYRDSTGKPAGIYPVIASEAFSMIGVQVRINSMSFNRVLRFFFQGASGIGASVYNIDRSKYGIYSSPYFEEKILIIAKKLPNTKFYKGMEFLYGKNVGIISGWDYGSNFEEIKSKVKIQGTNSDVQNLNKIICGRLDYALITEASFNMLRIKKEKFLKLMPIYDAIAPIKIYLTLPDTPSNKKILAQFNKAISNLYFSGAVNSIVRREIDKAYYALDQKDIDSTC